MLSEIFVVILFLILFLVAVAELFVFLKNKKDNKDLAQREGEAKYKTFEIAILNELNDKIGYSLGAENIVEVITRFLPDIIGYSTISYMLPLPEKIIFRVNINQVVSQKFIDDIKVSSLDYLSKALNKDFKNIKIDEMLRGPAIDKESNASARSLFSVPLIIGGKAAGLMTIAHLNNNFYKEKEIVAVEKIAQLAGQAVTRLQEVIYSENSKLNAMVASMTDGVVMTDIDYNILVVNPTAKKITGLEDKKDFFIQDFIDGLSGKIDLRDKIEEGVRLNRIFISDEIFINDRFFKVVVSPVNGKLKVLGCVIVFRDITKEKEVEKMKEEFTSMIVHELRSPLDSIKKIIEMIRATKMKKEKQAECLQIIYGSSSDMLGLVNNLLDMAKIEAGKFELIKQDSDIKEVVKNRILFFDIASKDAKVTLESQFGKDVPDKVLFDPHMISEVLNNFISNAMKFNIENGSIIIHALLHKKGVSLQKEAKDSGTNWFIKKDGEDIPNSLFVAVTNSGTGIPENQIDKLFKKFFQVKSISAKKGGTGLGLAITKSIIESHGGVVGVESTEGQGATFYFTIPILK
jgi:PAS domain S-box-containing protein